MFYEYRPTWIGSSVMSQNDRANENMSLVHKSTLDTIDNLPNFFSARARTRVSAGKKSLPCVPLKL